MRGPGWLVRGVPVAGVPGARGPGLEAAVGDLGVGDTAPGAGVLGLGVGRGVGVGSFRGCGGGGGGEWQQACRSTLVGVGSALGLEDADAGAVSPATAIARALTWSVCIKELAGVHWNQRGRAEVSNAIPVPAGPGFECPRR